MNSPDATGWGRNSGAFTVMRLPKALTNLAPHNNATSLQVSAGVLGAVVWAMENPQAGIIDPEEMDFQRVLEIANPYLGKVFGQYSDWNPLQGRNHPFPEDLDESDPWQFKNIRVV